MGVDGLGAAHPVGKLEQAGQNSHQVLLGSKRVLKLAVRLGLGVTAVAAAASRLFGRMQVQGDSMRPTLLPGDRLLILRKGRARVGRLVVLADPRDPSRLMVKRVTAVGAEGVSVLGDNPGASTDSRSLGPLARVRGRPVYRYHPEGRTGWIS